MGRRGAGDGSIYREAESGRWRGVVDLGRDGAGRRRRVKVTGRTRTEVLAKMREVRREIEMGLSGREQRLTLAELAERWLVASMGDLSPNTVANHEWAIKGHVIPALGQRRVRELTADEVAAFLIGKAEAGYARASLEKFRNSLRQVLRYGERQGLLLRNVATLIPTPRAGKTEGRTLTADQARTLLTALAGDSLEALVVTGLMCGLRPGELLGLTWADVDLEDGVLRVRHALKNEVGTLFVGETKTPRSRRALDLPSPVLTALRRHRTRQDAGRLRVGPDWQALDLVFPTDLGTPMDHSNLRRAFSRITTKAGLGHWHPHELRHSTASLLSAAGVPLEQIADMLGHAGTRVTEQAYRHQLLPTVSAGVRPMEQLFGNLAERP